MVKTHKAILIDVYNFEVREVELEEDNINQIYQHLRCDTFDCVGLQSQDAIYVDDEGLIRSDVDRYFAIIGYSPILAGNGLIVGTGEEGESVSPNLTLDFVSGHVMWFVRGRDGWLHRVADRPHTQAPQPGFSISEF